MPENFIEARAEAIKVLAEDRIKRLVAKRMSNEMTPYDFYDYVNEEIRCWGLAFNRHLKVHTSYAEYIKTAIALALPGIKSLDKERADSTLKPENFWKGIDVELKLAAKAAAALYR